MPRYRIQNKITKEWREVEAPYAQDACDLAGWPIGICFVQLLREGPYSDLAQRLWRKEGRERQSYK